jgi:ABC transporter substrate binding protein
MQFDRLTRREFFTLLGGGTAWPFAARAQQTGKLPIIGFLGTNTASAQREWTHAFVQRLRELGWMEGRTVAIEYRWAEGRLERSAEIAAELVRLKVDVIVTHSAEPVLAAKRETAVIPIVFPVAADPVGNGLVASLTRPGGNATGLSLQATDLAGKRVEILREVLPGFQRLGIVANIDAPAAVLEMREERFCEPRRTLHRYNEYLHDHVRHRPADQEVHRAARTDQEGNCSTESRQIGS